MPSSEEVARGAKRGGSGSGSKRGSVNNGRRLQAFSERRSSGNADWGDCDPKWLQDILVGITGLGGAVTFGLSRDGGAFSLTLLLDGDRETVWFNGDAELDTELEQVLATIDSMS